MNFFSNFTTEQIRAQYARNAEGLRFMLNKARISKTGKCNGYTVAELEEKVQRYEHLSENYTA